MRTNRIHWEQQAASPHAPPVMNGHNAPRNNLASTPRNNLADTPRNTAADHRAQNCYAGDTETLKTQENLGDAGDSWDGKANDAMLEASPASEDRSKWIDWFCGLPLEDAVAEAVRFNDDESKTEENWKSDLFHFVRLLHAHPAMAAMRRSPVNAFQAVEKVIDGWKHRDGVPPYGRSGEPWPDWVGISRADARAEFIAIWPKIRYRLGAAPLDQAVDRARQLRLILREDVRESRPVCDSSERDTSDYEFFISVAGHLQCVMRGRPILLPCRDVGARLGVSHMTASRYAKWALEDGYLSLHRGRMLLPNNRRLAAEYRFDLARWPALRDGWDGNADRAVEARSTKEQL